MTEFNIYLAILAVVVAGVLSCVPYVNKPSRFLVTFVHELGHGVVGFFVGGGFPSITLSLNEEGAAQARFNRDGFAFRLRRMIHLLAGYSTPVTAGAALIFAAWFGFIEQATWVLVGAGVVSILANILGGPFRNWFGILFSMIYTVLVFFMILVSEENAYLLVLFMGTTFLVRGVFDLVFIARRSFGLRLVRDRTLGVENDERFRSRNTRYYEESDRFVGDDLMFLTEDMGFGGPRRWFIMLAMVTVACVTVQVYVFTIWLS